MNVEPGLFYLEDVLDTRLTIFRRSGQNLEIGKNLNGSGMMGMTAENYDLTGSMALSHFQKHLSHRFAGKIGEPVVIACLPFIPAGLLKRRHVRGNQDLPIR